MNDSISRAAAIDALSRCQTYLFDTMDTDRKISLEDAEYVIEKLPSAQPERKNGKWVYAEDEYGTDGYHCNQCGFFVPWDYTHTFINYIEDYHFCPNCGTDMRGEADGD